MYLLGIVIGVSYFTFQRRLARHRARWRAAKIVTAEGQPITYLRSFAGIGPVLSLTF